MALGRFSMRRSIAELLHNLADAIGGLDARAERATTQRALEALRKLRDDAAEVVDEADAEAERRAAMGLLNAEVPKYWQSDYFMRQGYRVSTTTDDSQRHWRGGPRLHDDAVCPICDKPLLLFWDINCKDPRFQAESPNLFGDVDRLPLYYCCRRPEPTIYQLLSDGGIRMMKPELQAWEESPFQAYPIEFERRPLRLEPIPRDIENLLLIAAQIDCNWLNNDEFRDLAEYLHDSDAPYRIRLSQFGGRPHMLQGRMSIPCPNRNCLTHKMGHPMVRQSRHFEMKELAVIDDDSGFEMKTDCAQIAFHICWKCYTVHARYVCD